MKDRRKLTVHSVLQLNTPLVKTFFNGSPPTYLHHILIIPPYFFLFFFFCFLLFSLLSYIQIIVLDAHNSIDHCPYTWYLKQRIGIVLCDP